LKPDAAGLVMPGDKAEQWRMARGTPDVPSPLVADGLVYLAGSGGGLTCLDAKTGKAYYSRKPTHNHRHRYNAVAVVCTSHCACRWNIITINVSLPICWCSYEHWCFGVSNGYGLR
jgi:hypothetical protein